MTALSIVTAASDDEDDMQPERASGVPYHYFFLFVYTIPRPDIGEHASQSVETHRSGSITAEPGESRSALFIRAAEMAMTHVDAPMIPDSYCIRYYTLERDEL